jgi:hypothetical protein
MLKIKFSIISLSKEINLYYKILHHKLLLHLFFKKRFNVIFVSGDSTFSLISIIQKLPKKTANFFNFLSI